MGTVVTFDVVTPAPAARSRGRSDCAVEWLHWVDETFSTYKPDSEVCRFDRGELQLGRLLRRAAPDFRTLLPVQRGNGRLFRCLGGWLVRPERGGEGLVHRRGVSPALAEAGLPDHVIDGGGDVRLRGPPGRRAMARRRPPPARAGCLLRRLVARGRGRWPPRARTSGATTSSTRSPASRPPSSYRRPSSGPTSPWPMPTPRRRWPWARRRRPGSRPLTGYEALVIGPDGRGWSTRGWPRFLQERSPGHDARLSATGRAGGL